jgi:hypothetical protein
MVVGWARTSGTERGPWALGASAGIWTDFSAMAVSTGACFLAYSRIHDALQACKQATPIAQ